MTPNDSGTLIVDQFGDELESKFKQLLQGEKIEIGLEIYTWENDKIIRHKETRLYNSIMSFDKQTIQDALDNVY